MSDQQIRLARLQALRSWLKAEIALEERGSLLAAELETAVRYLDYAINHLERKA